jgi:hypothetical protein
MRNSAGMMDLKKWDCGVPGKDKTIWEGGLFKLEVIFPDGALYLLPNSGKLANGAQSTPRSHQSVLHPVDPVSEITKC